MPLSEHEQRLLEQIERALYADDPKFASTVRSSDPRNYLRRRVWRSLLLFLFGLVVLVLGVVINKGALTVVLGVAGFVLMLAAALRGASDLKRLSGRPRADPQVGASCQALAHGAARRAVEAALGRARLSARGAFTRQF